MPDRVRRVDRIASILKENDGRARARVIVVALRKLEGNDSLTNSSVWVAIQAENDRLEELGKKPLFATYRSGEDWGWIRLDETGSTAGEGAEAAEIEQRIRKANDAVDEKIRQRLREMDWRTFESTFLAAVLEKLGFQNVEVTQATRDGGVDARVTYQRGLVEAKAIVSAKHWNGRQSVPVSEVRQLRGIQGDEDTAIIVTTGKFTDDARTEARPSQNQRVVYLIDGARLVEICRQHSIGVKRQELPALLVLDELALPGDEAEGEEDETDGAVEEQETEDRPGVVRRVREEMLGDGKRGVSAAELAQLLGLEESSVRTYLAGDRRRNLLERIRKEPRLRSQVLKIVTRRRAER